MFDRLSAGPDLLNFLLSAGIWIYTRSPSEFLDVSELSLKKKTTCVCMCVKNSWRISAQSHNEATSPLHGSKHALCSKINLMIEKNYKLHPCTHRRRAPPMGHLSAPTAPPWVRPSLRIAMSRIFYWKSEEQGFNPSFALYSLCDLKHISKPLLAWFLKHTAAQTHEISSRKCQDLIR